MARRCALCGKKAMVAVTRKKLRGKYNPTGKKKKYPNLQWVILDTGKRVKACTRCIKTLNKHQLSKKKLKEIEKPKDVEKKTAKKSKVIKKSVKKIKEKNRKVR